NQRQQVYLGRAHIVVMLAQQRAERHRGRRRPDLAGDQVRRGQPARNESAEQRLHGGVGLTGLGGDLRDGHGPVRDETAVDLLFAGCEAEHREPPPPPRLSDLTDRTPDLTRSVTREYGRRPRVVEPRSRLCYQYVSTCVFAQSLL